MIEIRNLYLAFTKEYDALHNVNLTICDGEKVAIVGESDSGKTMLLRVLARLEKIKSGEIYIKDIDIKKINFKQDISVGFVPKSFVFLNNKTVRYNLEYILKARKFDQASINLKVMTALKYFDIESIQNLKIKELSPFQKTLVELARVSMRKVDLFLIDDVCSGLLPSERERIVEKMKYLILENAESTFVFALSDENIASRLNLKVINIEHGCIKEQEIED